MRPFDYAGPATLPEALDGDGTFLAGGTTLVDLMKLEVMTPERVIDITALPLRGITDTPDGLRVGALEPMDDVARDERTPPLVAQALAQSASPQLRNMATIGGNLLQRTRCGFFRDVATPCNKRSPGSGCPARDGQNRGHAVLGTSSSCVATHASDLAVALVALEATVLLASRDGRRRLPIADLYALPGDTPHLEHHLRPGELITEVVIPRLTWPGRYVKIRDRSSYEF
ncbi:MAG: xanthine dehydrogenase family protein subunit M, partial [Nonomuraea sp.]|nr:xanthine dehydrogenase family protein subunit M [Nonomuraea sp.]